MQSQAYYRQQDIERRTAKVTHVDVVDRRTYADGLIFQYDAAFLATGAKPQKPDFWASI